jgi:hypothetical protein
MKKRKVLTGLLAGMVALGALAATDSLHTTAVFHATTPAGYDVLLLKPSGSLLTFLGLIECPELKGVQQITQGVTSRLVSADGKLLANFPGEFSFRITASLRKTVLVAPTNEIKITEDLQDLLVGLKFRLRTYNGLEVREIAPESVQIIGVPADVPYDERIYRVSFSVHDLPVTDRCVLEVLSPDGKRLTKFHFDLL